MSFEKIIIRSPFINEYNEFSILADRCSRAGVTHLTFTEISRSFWELDDPRDPYLHWSIVHSSLFKILPPRLLSSWVPKKFAGEAQKTIRKKAMILKKNRLKGAAFFYDPMYWPESIFTKRPDLRGPCVSHPRRSIIPRYAPCIDNREVLEMFCDSFKKLYELSEGVMDTIIIRTNDSAAGFCWANLYNSPNGPERCRNLGQADRLLAFNTAVRRGITEAGGDPFVYIQTAQIFEAGGDGEAHFLGKASEKCGLFSHGKTRQGGEKILTGQPSQFWLYPVRHIQNPVEILENLMSAREKQHPNLFFFNLPTLNGSDWEGDSLVIDTIAMFLQNPFTGILAKFGLLKSLAEKYFGAEYAEDAVSAWENICRALEILDKNEAGGGVFFLYHLAQRWLVRPLVVFPEQIPEHEKAAYQRYIFQAEPTNDLLEAQAHRQFDGERHASYFSKHFRSAYQKFQIAYKLLSGIYAGSKSKDPQLGLQLASFRVLFCFLRTFNHYVQFQIKLETIKTAAGKNTGYGGSSEFIGKRAEINNIIRAEIDNTYELADLLEAEGSVQIKHADNKKEETPFLTGPDLIRDLRKKCNIMLVRMRDIDKLCNAPNI